MMDREWRLVKGYEHRFEVSNYGEVRSLPRRKTLKTWMDADGYYRIGSYADGHRVKLSPHRLVAEAFLSAIEGKTQVNHLDGVKTNNHVSNLEWADQGDNTRHAARTGLLKPAHGASHYLARLSEQNVTEIRRRYKPYICSYGILAAEYDVHWSCIRDIIKGRSWKQTIQG